MAKNSPLEFLQQVSAETAKVVWPTRRETGVTTLMVIIFAFIASIFFFLVDMVIRWGVTAILGLAK